jgi:peroxiredoxin
MLKKMALMACAVTLLAAAPGYAMVGTMAKDFTLKTMDGKDFKLSSLKDQKPVALVFWQSACATCVADMTFMSDQKAKHANVEFVSINVDARSGDAWKESIKNYLVQKKVTLQVLLDPEFSVGRMYGIGATPSTVLVGKDGKITAFFLGFKPGEDDKKISEALSNLK